MSKYIDSKYFIYDNISECLKKKNPRTFSLKKMLWSKIQLLVVDKNNKEILKTFDDVQPLYLYPLSILDYCNSLIKKEKNLLLSIVMINIIEFDSKIDYIEKYKNINLNNLKNIEIEITTKYNNNDLKKIISLLKKLTLDEVKITLNLKTLIIDNDILEELCFICDYFKIFMPSILNTPLFNEFKDKLKIICSNKKTSSVIHIKSYLNDEQNKYYIEVLKEFNKLKIDIFQLSKELIPLATAENLNVSKYIQKNIRKLEKKYNGNDTIKFISVKDISTLYYPRFELNEKNSRHCYSSIMKPYLYNDYLIPCKVSKVINDLDNWYISKLGSDYNLDNIKKCGLTCDDCASIFENDILNEIEKVIEKYDFDSIEFILKIGDEKCW